MAYLSYSENSSWMTSSIKSVWSFTKPSLENLNRILFFTNFYWERYISWLADSLSCMANWKIRKCIEHWENSNSHSDSQSSISFNKVSQFTWVIALEWMSSNQLKLIKATRNTYHIVHGSSISSCNLFYSLVIYFLPFGQPTTILDVRNKSPKQCSNCFNMFIEVLRLRLAVT